MSEECKTKEKYFFWEMILLFVVGFLFGTALYAFILDSLTPLLLFAAPMALLGIGGWLDKMREKFEDIKVLWESAWLDTRSGMNKAS